jgi:VWFA-related protein
MVHTTRRFGVAALCASWLGLAAWTVVGAQQGPPTPPQTPQQVPVFRSATNVVQVDAYPTKDGKIVEGLTAKDFQVLEDGKPQAIESFEFIRIEPNTAEGARRDPNTAEDGNRLAADPRNRVFVIYLDHFHASLAGSHAIVGPVVTMLNRMLTANDLFGVATAVMKPRDLVLGRQTTTIEDQLSRNWTWGLQKGVISLGPEEEGLVRCYGEPMALEISARLREERTLDSLGQFVRHLGGLREARKVLIVLSVGWRLYEPDQGRLSVLMTPQNGAGRTPIGVTGNGTLSTSQPNQPGFAEWNWCAGQASQAFNVDNQRRFRALIDEANRNNVAFYPVNVDGLATGERAENLRTLAENTDGLVTNTNDFNGAFRRIADDVSAYYMLSYTTSTKSDGAYHRLQVKVSSPGASVKARRGYVAPYPESAAPAATPAKPAVPAGITEALGVLSRLRTTADLFTYGVVGPADLGVVVEIPSAQVGSDAWAKGADVQVTAVDASGAASSPATGRIEAGGRSALIRIPRPSGAAPFRINVKVTTPGNVLTDRIDLTERATGVIGEPLLFRATPAAQSPLRPAADFQFWRTERLHVEWPAKGPLDRREAKLLGKDGRVLPVPVNLTERAQAGQPTLAADLNLAPLAPGDYIIEVKVAIGTEETLRYIPVRVLR